MFSRLTWIVVAHALLALACTPELPLDVEGPDPTDPTLGTIGAIDREHDEVALPIAPNEHDLPPPPPPDEPDEPPPDEPPPDEPDAPEDFLATCPRVRITTDTLNVRPDPSTAGAAVTQVHANQIVDVLARIDGEVVAGITHWYEIAVGAQTGFITSAYATCTFDEPPAAPDGYLLPLTCGSVVRIAQGNFGGFSHSGRSRFAYDFSIGVGTPMLAMADGEVIQLFDETGPGDNCYDGGGESCFPFANYVALRHGDGTQSIYKHLTRVDVTLGEFVPRGAQLGLSGSTGYSTGPHAHVMRQEDCGNALQCESVLLVFADVAGDGEPEEDDLVTSGNCL